jgi:hypothetical protein
MEFVSETSAADNQADATAVPAVAPAPAPVMKAAAMNWVDDKSSSEDEVDKDSDDSSLSSSVRL